MVNKMRFFLEKSGNPWHEAVDKAREDTIQKRLIQREKEEKRKRRVMNKQLQDYARQTILDGLRQCTPGQQRLFKQMYAFKHIDGSIEDAVANMPEEKLDWAMKQVEQTLIKKKSI